MKFRNVKVLAGSVAFSLMAFTHIAYAATDIGTCQIITQPGSYRLTQNLLASGTCLELRTSSVSIDLAGHAIVGAGTGAGIKVSFGRRENVAVRNGIVSNFNVGVDFRFVDGAVIERLRITDVFDGIQAGPGAIVAANIVRGAGRNGINVAADGATSSGSVITDNVVLGSGQNGISSAEKGSVVRGNAITQNANLGIFVQCPSSVIANAANANGKSANLNLVLFGTGCVSSQNSTAP